MEDGLGGKVRTEEEGEFQVLILVLVEDGLGDLGSNPNVSTSYCLNPCFSGGWSRSCKKSLHKNMWINVLILVLVEDGLGVVKLSKV